MKARDPRIISGRWRGRKLSVANVEGLRPTPDRIRETVFNWLAADCQQARVLDCFAGSGAMVFEAMSRGAQSAVALENSRVAVKQLRRQADSFGAEGLSVVQGDSLNSVSHLSGPFHLVFIDPPYAQPELRHKCFQLLEQHQQLAVGTKVYFEWPVRENFELPSEQLQWLRQKKAGQVEFGVAHWHPTG